MGIPEGKKKSSRKQFLGPRVRFDQLPTRVSATNDIGKYSESTSIQLNINDGSRIFYSVFEHSNYFLLDMTVTPDTYLDVS